MVALTGATGIIYGVRLLDILQTMPGVELHVVISPAAKRTLVEETDATVKQVEALADVVYDYRYIGAAFWASGSIATPHGDCAV